MAHTNSTTNYNLPQWVGSDKPTFLGDLNTAFNDIDAQMKTNADGIVTADDKAQNATTLANDAQDDVDALTLRVTTAEGDIANNTTLIGNNTTSINNLTSSVQTINTELTGKQNTITGAASTVTTNNLAASRVLVSDSSGKITNSSISDTELGRLSGVTSNIQSQINALKSDTLISARRRVPTNTTTYSLTQDIDNFTNLYFELSNSYNDVVDSALIPVSMFKNSSGIYLKTIGYEQPVGADLIYIKYVTDTSFSMKNNNGWETYLTVYGHM